MPTDKWPGDNSVEFGPADRAEAVTQSMIDNSTEFTRTSKGIYVGGDGDVNVIMKYGGTVLFKGVKSGTVLPVRAKAIAPDDGASPATSTTAASTLNLVALS